MLRTRSGFELHSDHWIEFLDENGLGWAQPDLWLWAAPDLWIFECKYTRSDLAEDQLQGLYAPLLQHVYKPENTTLVHVFKNPGPDFEPGPAPVRGLLDVLNNPATLLEWHWLR